MRAYLGVRCDAARIIVGGSGNQAGPEAQQKMQLFPGAAPVPFDRLRFYRWLGHAFLRKSSSSVLRSCCKCYTPVLRCAKSMISRRKGGAETQPKKLPPARKLS